MRVKQDFVSYLKQAILDINSSDWPTWCYIHASDLYYNKTVEKIFVDIFRTETPWASFPPRDYDKNPEAYCAWLITNGLNYSEQSIPSELLDYYMSAAEPERTAGAIRRKYPYHINDAKNYRQLAVRAIFKAGTACFNKQLNYKAITDPTIGPKSRGYWFNAALVSGLWYYDFFMKQTLNIMFGPLIHDEYPFLGATTPDWCADNTYCERWKFHQTAPDDFIFSSYGAVLPAGISVGSIRIKAEGDNSEGSPGDPDVLDGIIGFQALNEDGEATGDISFVYANPIGSVWDTPQALFSAGPGTTQVYIAIFLNHGNGDYFLYFQDAQIISAVSKLERKVYGAAGDSFAWDVGQGLFSFDSFVPS